MTSPGSLPSPDSPGCDKLFHLLTKHPALDLGTMGKFLNILGKGIVRIGSSPWDVSPWHKDYFELQTIKTQLIQEVAFLCVCFITSPFSSLRIQMEKPASEREL